MRQRALNTLGREPRVAGILDEQCLKNHVGQSFVLEMVELVV